MVRSCPCRAFRCFRNELRRLILALAVRTASARVGFCFDCGALVVFPTVGIAGSTWVGLIEARSTGCVLMGPVIGSRSGIRDNAFQPDSFNGHAYLNCAGVTR